MRAIQGVTLACALLGAAVLPAAAQSSTSFQVSDSTFTQGGNPAPSLVSSRYAVTLSAIGEIVSAAPLTSASFRVDGGLVGGNAPAREVLGLRLGVDRESLYWGWTSGADSFDVYRGDVSRLASGDYGTCLATRTPATTWIDADLPAAGRAFFYLVGARNRLGERGPLGTSSAGAPRTPSSPCL